MFDFFLIFVLPTIVISIILFLCKYYNFSILPSDMKGKTPKKFTMPRFTRKQAAKEYKWENKNDDSDDSESEYFSDDEYENRGRSRSPNMYD